MQDSEQTLTLLTEIRDLQQELLQLYREEAARSAGLAERSVAQQVSLGRFYKRVVLVAAVVVVVLLGFLWKLVG